MEMYLQKVGKKQTIFEKIKFFVGVLKVNDENSRVRIRSQMHRSEDPDPYPHQNVMDPQHCLEAGNSKQ